MKKKLVALVGLVALSFFAMPVNAISDEQKAEIKDHCETIRESLKTVQKNDSRTRVFLGARYETLLSKYITPFNIKMVENNMSASGLVENQTQFAEDKVVFANDFVAYQQKLEELVGMDCKEKPEEFYDELVLVRQKRKIMVQDVLKMRAVISEHLKLVDGLKGKV